MKAFFVNGIQQRLIQCRRTERIASPHDNSNNKQKHLSDQAVKKHAGNGYSFYCDSLHHLFRNIVAQFSPDGLSIVTASWDKTARVWSCKACGPIEEIATELKRRVDRDFTDEERRRFGVPDDIALEE